MLIWPKKRNTTKHKNLLSPIKMGKGIFGNIEIEENKYYHNKTPIFKRFRYWESWVSNKI